MVFVRSKFNLVCYPLKFLATPTKQSLCTSEGFFSKFHSHSFYMGVPPGTSMYSQTHIAKLVSHCGDLCSEVAVVKKTP